MTNVAQNTQKILEKDLHQKFIFYGKNAKEWTRKCALLLPEINHLQIWKKKGFENIYEYARILAGMSTNAVNDALRILKKVENKPELKWVINKKGINAVRPIVSIATQETANFWAEKAMEMSKNTLEAYVKEFKKEHTEAKVTESIFCPSTENRHSQNLFSKLKMELDPKITDQLNKLKGQGNWNELMQKLLQAYQAQLEASKPIPQENAKRYVPAKIKNYVLIKTNNTCAFPGCTKEYKYLHHTWRFALTKTHDPDSLIPLCKAHEHLAHAGLIENENQSPENWKIKLETDKTSKKWQKIDKWVSKYYTGEQMEKRTNTG
ncbi:MAG: hypothetical protein US89_C0003G0048 [Candidatus Peregrinibacteria bacterium GW2011_GWF2_38_29]|nr:MAG: hypothetical protein US89_C0003G0048 [Candidatus Peregrinibacteria bacterium GW2011_GWF2_38_29]HBB02930.1 hypothetical protein [Candidatus Peregrinibacteria bacterium]